MPRIVFPFIAISLAAAALLNSPASAQSQPEKEFRFEVFSIRPMPPGQEVGKQGIPDPTPDGFFTTRTTLQQAVTYAYGPPGLLIVSMNSVKMRNDPPWFADYYDINARVSQSDLKAWQNQSKDHELLRAAIRAALKERCNLALHEQPTQERTFELVLAKGGPKLKPADPNTPLPVGVKLRSGGVMTGIGDRGRDGWNYHGATVQDLADQLSSASPGIPVRDRTGLTGRYDFPSPHVQVPADEERVYSFPVDRLGLKLKPGTENRPILVIDHVEKPTPN